MTRGVLRRRAAAALAVALAAGCSTPPPEPLGRAEGTVTLDGKPVAGGKLDFVSAASSVATPIGQDGTFVVPSLPAGKYKVAVGPVPAREAGNPAAGVFHKDEVGKRPAAGGPAVPKKYASPDTSGIEVEIGPTPKPIEIRLTTK